MLGNARPASDVFGESIERRAQQVSFRLALLIGKMIDFIEISFRHCTVFVANFGAIAPDRFEDSNVDIEILFFDPVLDGCNPLRCHDAIRRHCKNFGVRGWSSETESINPSQIVRDGPPKSSKVTPRWDF